MQKNYNFINRFLENNFEKEEVHFSVKLGNQLMMSHKSKGNW